MAKISLTFPDAMWVTGMSRLLIEGYETGEHGVDGARVGADVEGRVEIDARGDLVVGAAELAEVDLLLPGAHRRALDEAVRVVAREPRLDERGEGALAGEVKVAPPLDPVPPPRAPRE